MSHKQKHLVHCKHDNRCVVLENRVAHTTWKEEKVGEHRGKNTAPEARSGVNATPCRMKPQEKLKGYPDQAMVAGFTTTRWQCK